MDAAMERIYSLEARVLALEDALEAITGERPS